jgi:signal transduction histidine kinase
MHLSANNPPAHDPADVPLIPPGWSAWTYRDVLENLHVGVIVLNIETAKVEYCNPASTQLLRAFDIPPDYCTIRDRLQFHLPPPRRSEIAGFSRTLQQRNRLLGYRSYAISPQSICLFVHDISEKARLEAIAQTVNTMDNIGIVFSGIRHEIGNPLNSMKMAMSVLRANLDTFPAETIGAYIERALSEIARMEYMLRALKSFSMFETFDIRDTDLADFVARFLQVASDDFAARGIALHFQPPAAALPVQVDPRALHQALLNLLANAADALDGRTAPQIRIELSRQDHLAWLAIHDNGCGMDEEQLRQLFLPFHTSKAGGNGLGLVITRKFLAGMACSIEFSSTLGQGTSVTIAIPLAGVPTDPNQETST